MIRNYLKIAWRNFYKQRFYSAINVLGLAMGIGCAIILFIFISFHLSFDTYHNNAKRTYRIVNDLHIGDGTVFYDQGSPIILGKTLQQQNPAIVKEAVLLKKRSFTVAVKPDDQTKADLYYENENIAFTNNDLFDIFTYNWLHGNAGNALSAPGNAVITAGLAKKYFNTDDAIGRTIRLDDKTNITITGVIQDNVKNTDIRADLFISLASLKDVYPDLDKPINTDWRFISSKTNVFVLLNNAQAGAQVNNSINSIRQKFYKGDVDVYQFHLQPLSDIHFNSRYSGTIAKPLLAVLALVGLALLLIAGVNFINMATAQSLTRAKEIGTRKVLGSSPAGIFWQFMAETAYVAIAATLLALLTVMLFLPVLNNWLQLPLSISGGVFVFLPVLLLLLILVAGFYPAVILSRFKPANALKNMVGQSNGSRRFSRDGLIVLQNVIAQVLIVCALIITLQVKMLINADMGFNKDAVILVPIHNTDLNALDYLRNQLNSNPAVKNVSYCYSAPADFTNKGGSVRYNGKDWENFSVNSIIGDEQYISTFKLKLLAGHPISSINPKAQFIINQQLLAKLKIKSPQEAIGRSLTAGDFSDKQGTIVGVVKDFNSLALYQPVQPLLIAAQPDYYRYAAIKIAGGHQLDLIDAIKQTYRRVFPQYVFEYHFVDKQIADLYQKEMMINKLIKAGTMVAIFISCLGLLGLISLVTVQRIKEIGIRKVLGASVMGIVTLLTKDFIRLILVAMLISSPFAWWLMHTWLQNFAYRVEINWWVFGLSGVSAITIACITISIRSVKAALANPVNSLRDN
ncbi:ABC transporter permease [Mucilaginibacter mali]|uniref:ABC transporter permease n=1 Tax=Mucilaginibacter mali TaxID=2740462 RepID=A0A7D4Q735_9SPHI|nr:ABC transporter permease [Mucilaginibacter mali]QKJ29751.1 ABC transporter permease [Mucilaginibacter mali]